jgi:cysteine synthase
MQSSSEIRMQLSSNVLDTIGNTSLVELRRVVPAGCARIVAKVEGENPTGSMKDRVALSMIGRPEADGRLKAGDTIVEYTGGSTGTSLALVCAVKRYPIRIVTSDAFSEEKLAQMAAFGAELTLVPSENGKSTKSLFLAMIAAAREMSRQPNRDCLEGYLPLGEEIWSQTGGKVDAFVQSVGTSHSLRGVVTALRRHNPSIAVVAVEPAESPVLSGGQPGPHGIEGTGIGSVPPLWDPALVHEVVSIPTADAEAMARRLAREEGLFAGTSSGANVLAAIQLGRRLGAGATVATLLIDSGLRYISTCVFRRHAHA